MKNFFGEFKKFITRGNVVDMSVGVIVGGAFTAIVNGLSNFVLKPLINALLAILFGANSLSELHTYLKTVYVLDANGKETAEIDLVNSIYIDWGSFINAIINFFLTALVLFTIVKIFNKVREQQNQFFGELFGGKVSKVDRKAMKAEGFNPKNEESVKAYFELKAKREAEAKAAAEEAAVAARLANPTTEDLLKEIRDLLKADK